jgi:signal transduction histidine kinase
VNDQHSPPKASPLFGDASRHGWALRKFLALLRWQPSDQSLTLWQRRAFIGMALPLAAFILLAVLLPTPTPQVQKVQQVEMWVQPVGRMVMTQSQIEPVLLAPPQLQAAQWTTVTLPHSQPLPESIDLPADAPVALLWLRIRIPDALLQGRQTRELTPGQLGLMGNRVMGGPWALWVNGELVQASLRDWRITWNVPLRVGLPTLRAQTPEPEILLSVLHPQAKGYAIGSIFMGPIDDVDQAWRDRNLWHVGVGTVTAAIALTMTLVCWQLARIRRQEPIYGLLTLTAFMWLASGFQYTHDFSQNDSLSLWFGWAVDASINWIISLSFLFTFAFEGLRFPRLRLALLAYAVASTVVTMPMWGWDKNALVLQHIINLGLFIGCAAIMTYHAWRVRTRESVLLAVANWLQFLFGIHSIFRLTNQSHPDDFFLFQVSSTFLFAVFMYITNRRYGTALQRAEQHELILHQQLQQQAVLLEQQHQEIRKLELAQGLARQHQAFALDLHDRVGNLLVTAKRQIHEQDLSQHDMLSVLEDIGHEVRDLSSPKVHRPSTVMYILADTRERLNPRLRRMGIALDWHVDVNLPDVQLDADRTQDLRALLSEAVGNACKHAHASRIEVRAHNAVGDVASKSPIVISIRDNGEGFDPDTVQRGKGLDGMHERALRLGAALHLTSEAGRGCELRLQLPL